MNATIKTILLTVLTLSVFVIALLELSGVTNNSIRNLFGSTSSPHMINLSKDDQAKRDEETKKLPKTSMEVPDTKYIFGKVIEGDKVRHTWKVKNTGQEPLFIANVQTSCGCTAPFFPKEPILPGAEGEITLEFNSAGKAKDGHVIKNALIFSNTDTSPFSIGFEADVEEKK